MSLAHNDANHDPIASVYATLPINMELPLTGLEQLMLQHLSKGAHILDVGCAHGEVVQQLHMRGYQMTGLDVSEELLRLAQKNAPESKFIHSDIRKFQSPPTYDGVYSIGVFNFFLNLEELTTVFQNLYKAMHDNSLFVFTMPTADFTFCEDAPNLESIRICEVSDKSAYIETYNYNQEKRIREIKVTIFELINGIWKRTDTITPTKEYFVSEIKSTLENVGFIEISVYDSRDFGDETSITEPCFVCRKPS